MKTKQKTNWWLGLVLFTGFILTFFLDLTGIELHQWIGILIGVLAALHMLLHFNWIDAVTKRFFSKTSGQARVYYSIDVLLVLGFSLIGITGLVISTWLNLSLSNYFLWLSTHISISIVTLVVLLAKLALHSRWIVRITRKIMAGPAPEPVRNSARQPGTVNSSSMGRREFIQVMGIVGVASLFALVSGSNSLAEAHANVTTVEASSDSIAAVDLQNVSSPSSDSCTVQCHKSCSYPGHCHKYSDSNGNGKCDLGECA